MCPLFARVDRLGLEIYLSSAYDSNFTDEILCRRWSKEQNSRSGNRNGRELTSRTVVFLVTGTRCHLVSSFFVMREWSRFVRFSWCRKNTSVWYQYSCDHGTRFRPTPTPQESVFVLPVPYKEVSDISMGIPVTLDPAFR